MTLDDLMQDPYAKKVLLALVGMLARDYQARALDMTSEELYENSEFFPMYNPDTKDYSKKPVGYTCKDSNGNIMQLLDGNAYAMQTMDLDGEEGSSPQIPIVWRTRFSTNPALAKPFNASETSPYGKDECCVFESKIYRSLVDNNIESPGLGPDKWEEVKMKV